MNTLDMEIALMKELDIRRNIIVPNVSWGINGLHECDLLLLTKSGYAWEIEIKVSKSDLLKDKEKSHNHSHNHILQLFFAVPYKLREIALEEIPENAGLYTVRKRTKIYEWESDFVVKLERSAKRNTSAIKWNDKDVLKLTRLGTMRILGLKEKINRLRQ